MATTLPGTPYVEASDLVAAYPAASENLADRVDLVGVLPFADSAARATALPTPTDGQFTYLQDTNSPEFYNGTAFVGLGGGKILQVIRATDVTSRSTSSATFVDVTGMSVTITPQKATSNIIIMAVVSVLNGGSNAYCELRITNAANTAISGAEAMGHGSSATNPRSPYNIIGFDSPAVTTAVTYKLRHKLDSGSSTIVENNTSTGQIYAIEVAA